MFDIMNKIQEAQKQMEDTKKRLSELVVSKQFENGLIKIVANCNLKIVEIEISESLLQSANKSELEDLLIVAINKTLDEARETQDAEMSKVAKGMLPGIGGLFGK
jgi:nucleoid-associated protein EbfC